MIGLKFQLSFSSIVDYKRMETLSKVIKLHNVNKILDVGANTGQFVEEMFNAGFPGVIISFEPTSSAYSELIEKQVPGKWVVAERCAIGAEDKEVKINVSDPSFSSSILPIQDILVRAHPKSAYIGSERVKMLRLDTAAKPYMRPSDTIFLKVDAQGYEKFVLDGAEKIMDRIVGIQLESSLTSIYEGDLLVEDAIKKVRGYGFELYSIMPGYTDPSNERMLAVDCIFSRRC